jgi:periplasmic divalent cation tolerance protein
MLLEQMDGGLKDIVFIYTTCSSIEEARSIGLSSVNEKLAISADYWFIDSIYPWNGVVQEAEQYMLMLSTQKELSDELIKHIEVRHSYHVPMIARCDIPMTNHLYHSWVENTLTNKDEYISESEEREKEHAAEYKNSRLK